VYRVGPLTKSILATVAIAGAILVAGPPGARAFCGFYVSGADAELYANATMVVLMRDGRRTVLSMQNDYQGPPEGFALVVPVPTVLDEENVRTLDKDIFARVDQLAAPRLVEYWEQDPCYVPPVMARGMARAELAMGAPPAEEAGEDAELGVTVEAQFTVGEYEIVILSAQDSAGLDTWLRQEEYNIPTGAEGVLRPYVEQGTKFFVAKVDPEKVAFVNGKAVLSPLRVHYDAPELVLPVRLGLLNSAGSQDLIVHVLARGRRYEVANYPNATIPTNQVVPNAVRESFGRWYESLFQKTLAEHPGAVVTEYAWDASSCDPCPTPPLSPGDLLTLGADVLPNGGPGGFTLTRLHYRYDSESLGEDLVFRSANGIVGGRGTPDAQGRLREQAAAPQGFNNFQGRYVMLHWWEGPISCESPNRGRWGGPPGGGPRPEPVAAPSMLRATAEGTALAGAPGEPGPGGAPPGGGATTATPPPAQGGDRPSSGGCASCALAPGAGTNAMLGSAGLPMLALASLLCRRRRRRRRHP